MTVRSDPPTRRAHPMPFGPEIGPDGTTFRLWAPKAPRIDLAVEGREPRPMEHTADGWFRLTVPQAGAGTRYRFRLPDGLLVPDPASRWQPEDVHGPSEVIDPCAFAWTDGDWTGRPWHEAVLYECHVGAFTPAGTFAGVAERLDHLVGLGVTGLCLMPVADFPGNRSWGYDGVLLYAPDASYGRPEDLKALVDAAHARGMMVLLDVVYNHFGPDGNYLPLYAPIFNETHRTPWGAAVNVDPGDARWVREFIVHNALYWLEEFHLDGLRLDAVHAIRDESEQHLLRELAGRVRAATAGRHVHLVLENEENDPDLLRRDEGGTPMLYTAQWNDDVHHGLHVALTGESEGYYGDYAGDVAKLARALAEGFAYQGELMPYRGAPRGGPSGGLPPGAFVAFLQNHDQVGNRAFGDRLASGTDEARLRAALTILLLGPQVPMLFMGEEWGATQPFPFFCDFEEPLAEAVRQGRRSEFARFAAFADPLARERIPDPTADATFRSAKLDWTAVDAAPGRWLGVCGDLLRIRRERVLPLLPAFGGRAGQFTVHGPGRITVTWTTRDGRVLGLDAQLGDGPAGPGPRPGVEVIAWAGPRPGASPGGAPGADRLGPWSVLVWLAEG